MPTWERGIWIDTEGSILSYVNKRTGYLRALIDVAQNERQPMEDYRQGARRDGTKCHVTLTYYAGRPVYHARVEGIRNVAEEVKLVEGYIRTEKRRLQILKFRRMAKSKVKSRRLMETLIAESLV